MNARVSLKDFRFPVANRFLYVTDAKLSMHACHTRSERFSSPSATYENSTDIHVRSKYECSSLVKDFRLRAANRFLWRDAKLSTCACHTSCHHLSPHVSTHGNNTDTHLRSECECPSLAKDFRFSINLTSLSVILVTLR